MFDWLTAGYFNRACPLCGGVLSKVLYIGLPGKLCDDCACLVGPALWAAGVAFNGCFAKYSGGYWGALWRWLCGGDR